VKGCELWILDQVVGSLDRLIWQQSAGWAVELYCHYLTVYCIANLF